MASNKMEMHPIQKRDQRRDGWLPGMGGHGRREGLKVRSYLLQKIRGNRIECDVAEGYRLRQQYLRTHARSSR